VVPQQIGRGLIQALKISEDFQMLFARGVLTQDILCPINSNDWLHLWVMQKGTVQWKIDGNTVAEVRGGSALMLDYPVGKLCEKITSKGDVAGVSVAIRKSALRTFIGDCDDNLPPSLRDMLAASLGQFRLSMWDHFDYRMDTIAHEIQHAEVPPFSLPLYLKGKAINLICCFLAEVAAASRIQGDAKGHLPARDRKAIAYAKTIIDDTMMVSLTLPELARKVGVNRTKLSSGFHHLYGTTIKDYCFDLKMRGAEDFIRSREGTLDELALILGYSHPVSLSAAVKKHFGAPPRELAKIWGAPLRRTTRIADEEWDQFRGLAE
jgi:AraC-like DNA-binding protein